MLKIVDLEKTATGLRLTLTADGRTELSERPIGEYVPLTDILEYQLCNGWETVAPEDIGALTDGDIISEDVTRDDNGKLTACGRVYWFADYQVTDPREALLSRGELYLTAAD